MFPGGKFVIAVLALYSVVCGASSTEVRVRLLGEQTAVDVTGFDLQISAPSLFMQSDPRTGLRKAHITARGPALWRVVWDKGGAEILHTQSLWVHGQMVRLGPMPEPDDLEILGHPGRGLDVIARLELETYLLGVLPAEMPLSWPLEALKAQAVAARSYVLGQMRERKNENYDVDASVNSQVYRYFNDTDAHPAWATKLSRAVKETAGLVLTDRQSRVLKAYYSADCGCQSEDPKFVWGKVEAFESVKDPSCRLHPAAHWSLNLERSEVRSKLLAALDLPATSELRALHVSGRTPSGRVSQVVMSAEVKGKAEVHAVSAQEFRHIFGFQRVQSADFSMRWLGDRLEILGQGSGHGVGLCQTGARALASEGKSHIAILKLYYPRAKLYDLGNLL